MFVYAFLLFFVLTPGILVTLPPRSLVKNSSKIVIAAVHAAIFAIVWTLTHKVVWRASSRMFEGMAETVAPDYGDSGDSGEYGPKGHFGPKGKSVQMGAHTKPAKMATYTKK